MDNTQPNEEVKEMSQQIRVYWFGNNGLGGPVEQTIDAVLDNARTELEEWADNEETEPLTLTITTGFMKQSEFDALPEFEGY